MAGGPVALEVRLFGRVEKRGIIQRLPARADLVAEAETWLRTEYADALRFVRVRPTAPDGVALDCDLYPAVGPVVVTFDGAGRVTVAAETGAAGPGYHTFVWRLIDRLGTALAISWSETDVPPAEIPDGLRLPAPDRASIERDHREALRQALGRIHAARRDGAPPRPLGLRQGTRFSCVGALATPLGPRDGAWLDAALADPAMATDVIPWWTDATNGHYLLNRALCLMWTDIRWRRPATDDERSVVDEALRLLRRAHALDAAQPFPWPEWAELLELRSVDDALAEHVRARAAASPRGSALIGYRRRPVLVVHEGWGLEVPGSFAERRTAEEWLGREAGRQITLAAVSTGHGPTALRPEAFLDQVAGGFGSSVIRHDEAGVVGRARLDTDASSGMSTYVLEGYSAVVGSGAAIRVEFDDPDDWTWAVERWRALRPA